MRWRLILEEFGPELKYIKGNDNVVADALSRLEILPHSIPPTEASMADHFGLEEDDLPPDVFPLNYKTLMIHQQQDKALFKLTETNKAYCPMYNLQIDNNYRILKL